MIVLPLWDELQNTQSGNTGESIAKSLKSRRLREKHEQTIQTLEEEGISMGRVNITARTPS